MTYLNSDFIETQRLRNVIIRWTVGAVTYDLHPRYLELRIEREISLPEATAHNASEREFLPGQRGARVRLSLHADAALIGPLSEGTAGALVYGPEGDTTGKPKRGFDALVERFCEVLNHQGMARYEVTFRANGGLIEGAF
ncbi:MAG: hypothetical protein IAE83_21875 [Anaerolinea sp.]|nr:hypothetical protein [Anaerolinea sp.]MCC6972800.1 hypothetical protein [Anaerolineae bacterium]CAG1012725.1 hypothetical protein ANRL4_04722 [Anaerolineae bacterium]